MLTNRLQSALPAPDILTNPHRARRDLEAAHYSAARAELPAALFAPLHYEPNYAYPLVVWLHGASDDESQLKRVMPLISMRNYVAVAPRGPRRQDRAAGKPAYTWPQSAADWAVAEQRTFEAIEMAQDRFHISPRRMFVAGYDCGGTMAFRLAMDHPRRFAGVLSLCGRFPNNQTPLRRLSDCRKVPVFLACGRDSHVYASIEVCNNLRLFHSAGMNVSLRQYPCGHEIVPAMLADMDRWIMEQITAGSPAAVGETSAR
ncbi:MAG TPA: alpha/beta hydrolase-fold protein [Pirellulales bacterium]|nr:alpha/beta hydrolase-fold protein [Pirellulales bacterium]